ncbi:MAG TPA: SulP family inorganic anion transporter, partial [Polyangiales bacterium]|nr:SulP family inorganic anion transporter [Polyangiales bacterium]
FGGCKFQVTGSTAAFVVVLAPILVKHGLAGLLTAGFLAGVILIVMGFAGMGSWIQYIPHPVTSGFTAGIAAVIATLQIKDVLGLQTGALPEHYVDKLAAMWQARGTARPAELAVAAAALAIILFFPRITKRIPSALVAITVVGIASAVLQRVWPGFHVDTIGTRFHTVIDGVQVAGIPSRIPSPGFPWGSGLPSFELIRELFPAAFAIAMLGAIESLLSAVIADGMTNTKHEPNSELVALGIGNLAAPIFGGIAATGALARTGVNIRAGARSPFAAVTHSVFVLVSMLVLAPLLAYVPMAALSGLLLVVAWNMSEVRTVSETLRVAPKSDNLVLITCFLLTVFFDMVVAVSVGFVLAAVMFMRRMSELTESRIQLDRSVDGAVQVLPRGVVIYEINGPLFFGAAQKAMRLLDELAPNDFRVLIVHLGRVPVIDATGLLALRGALEAMLRTHRQVVLAGPLPKPRSIFQRADLERRYEGKVFIRDDEDAALELATTLAAASLAPAAPQRALG